MVTTKSIFLPIGKLMVVKEATTIWTVLGSCVSIVIFDRITRYAAICHAQLPEKGENDYACRTVCPNPCHHKLTSDSSFKYVTCSINYMVSKLNELGVSNNSMIVSLVGGASLFNLRQDGKSVGEKNAEIALDMVRKHKLNLVKQDLGGNVGRKLLFNSGIGQIDVQYQKQQQQYIDIVKHGIKTK